MNEEEEQVTQNQLIVTEHMRSYIYQTAKWAGFLGMAGLIFSGFTAFGAFAVGSVLKANPELNKMFAPLGDTGVLILTIFYLLFAFAIFYPSLLLYQFSGNAKQGILYGEQENLEVAMRKIKSIFKYFGILALIVIGLYVFMLIVKMMG